MIERAQASLEAAREPVALSRVVFHSTRWRDARGDLTAQEGAGVAADGRDADGTPVAPLSLTIEDAPGRVVEESAREPVPPSRAAALTPAPESSLKIERGSPSSSDLHDSTAPAGARNNAPTGGRALRESRRGGESFETSVLPQQGMAGGGVLPKSAAEAALREREMRAAGVPMPRRVLLTVSDPARMAQVNLLLRSASYEVRAAFDGGQALDLLRIVRADLLLLDYELKLLDGLEVLRRLGERHRGQLPLPVVLLYPPSAGAPVREEARRLGATGFVQLPYDPAELLAAENDERTSVSNDSEATRVAARSPFDDRASSAPTRVERLNAADERRPQPQPREPQAMQRQPVHQTPARAHVEDAERVIFSVRPTMLFVGLGYALAALAAVGLTVLLATYNLLPVHYSVLVSLLFLLIPAYYHLRRNSIKYTLTDSKVEIDQGLVARRTRNIPLRNIQDVTVAATIPQRILGFGDLIIDNASELGGTTLMHNIPSPRQRAEELLRELRRWN
ncbi:MAG: PH domain-containing protein [Acidobacteria bacterium]|nr:PH domain-containing protein [Acidobacteriota bacterium]